MTTDFRDLIIRMANELDGYRQMLLDDRTVTHRLSDEARAALAQADEPAVPEGREPVAVTGQPSDEELLRMAAEAIEPYDEIGIGEYEAETECAVEVYGSELIAFARAVLARAGNPVSEGREPVAVTGQPRHNEIRLLYCQTFDLRCDPDSIGPAPVKFARAVLARFGTQQ